MRRPAVAVAVAATARPAVAAAVKVAARATTAPTQAAAATTAPPPPAAALEPVAKVNLRVSTLASSASTLRSARRPAQRPISSRPRSITCQSHPVQNTVGKVKQYGRVQLAAGYDDNFGMIFDGTVLLYVIGKENPVDSYIEIHGGDGDELLNHGAVALNWPAGSTPSQRIKDMLSAANIPVGEVQTVKGEQKSVRA